MQENKGKFVDKRRSLSRRCLDWLFGRDFFISYRWSDGRDYAVKLAEKLRSERFECFLDSDGYVKGDNWQRVGERELKRTSRLVLIGSPEVHDSKAVEHELRVFGANQNRIIAVEFGESLSRERFPDSPVLSLLDEHIIRHKEPEEALSHEPSDQLVAELKRVFTGETTTVRRLRAIQFTAVILLGLTALAGTAAFLAHRQYRLNVQASALEDSRRSASELESGNHDLAIGHLIRSLERNPRDASVASALMRFGIEQPAVRCEKLISGSHSSVQISRDGHTVALLSADEGLMLLRSGFDTAWVALEGRRASQFHLTADGKAVAVIAGQEVGRCLLASKEPPIAQWQDFGAMVTAVAAGRQGDVLIGDSIGNLYRWQRGGKPQLLEQGSEESGAVRQVAWIGDSMLPSMLRADGYWQLGLSEEVRRIGQSDPSEEYPATISSAGVIWTPLWDSGELEGDGPRSQLLAWQYSAAAAEWVSPGQSPEWPRTKFKSLSTDVFGRSCIGLLDTDEVVLAGFLPDRRSKLSRSGVSAAALSPDGSVAVTVHMDGTMRRWEGEHLAPLGAAVYVPGGITQLALSADASVVLASAPNGVWQLNFPANQAQNDPRRLPSVGLSELPKTFRSLSASEKRKVSDAGRQISRMAAPGYDRRSDGQWMLSGGDSDTEIDHSMTEEELKKLDAVWESSHFAVMPGTDACISGDGKRVATAAGSQPIRIWNADSGSQINTVKLGEGMFVRMMALSTNGRQLFCVFRKESGNRTYYQIFDLVASNVTASERMPLYLGEDVSDVSADLTRVLIETTETAEIRETTGGRVLAGIMSVNAPIHLASFCAKDEAVLIAARDGNFRLWRASDATPLCAVTTFDPLAEEKPLNFDDFYHCKVWEETTGSGRQIVRRLAFRMGFSGALEQSGLFRLFDLGLAGTGSDHKRFARMMADYYGVSLLESGGPQRREPVERAVLKSRYLRAGLWDEPDMECLAKWIIEGSNGGQISPFSEGH
jgi:WD40 repeat protein